MSKFTEISYFKAWFLKFYVHLFLRDLDFSFLVLVNPFQKNMWINFNVKDSHVSPININ